MRDRTLQTELRSAEAPSRRRTPWPVGITVAILILIVLGFVAVRLSVDVPSLVTGTVPDEAYDARFVRHPWLTYLHIGPGVLYLIGAPLQLAYWFRRRHYAVHRRLGQILLGAGLLTGAMAVVQHRRWMIRAFAIGVGVGTIRIWIALFVITGLLDLPAAFGPAFWIAFTMHALAAELWLRTRPLPPEMITEIENATPRDDLPDYVHQSRHNHPEN
jgi:hypothetical protein